MFSRQGEILYLSWNISQRLDHMFSEKRKTFHWKKDILVHEKFAEAIRVFTTEQKEKNISVDVYVRIKFDKQEISIGSRMVATFERIVAIQTPSGVVIPGHLTIGVTKK
jgi:hypothetical protein